MRGGDPGTHPEQGTVEKAEKCGEVRIDRVEVAISELDPEHRACFDLAKHISWTSFTVANPPLSHSNQLMADDCWSGAWMYGSTMTSLDISRHPQPQCPPFETSEHPALFEQASSQKVCTSQQTTTSSTKTRRLQQWRECAKCASHGCGDSNTGRQSFCNKYYTIRYKKHPSTLLV